jgi:hypothetical protein
VSLLGIELKALLFCLLTLSPPQSFACRFTGRVSLRETPWGVLLAKQALYHFEPHLQSIFALVIFEESQELFAALVYHVYPDRPSAPCQKDFLKHQEHNPKTAGFVFGRLK